MFWKRTSTIILFKIGSSSTLEEVHKYINKQMHNINIIIQSLSLSHLLNSKSQDHIIINILQIGSAAKVSARTENPKANLNARLGFYFRDQLSNKRMNEWMEAVPLNCHCHWVKLMIFYKLSSHDPWTTCKMAQTCDITSTLWTRGEGGQIDRHCLTSVRGWTW